MQTRVFSAAGALLIGTLLAPVAAAEDPPSCGYGMILCPYQAGQCVPMHECPPPFDQPPAPAVPPPPPEFPTEPVPAEPPFADPGVVPQPVAPSVVGSCPEGTLACPPRGNQCVHVLKCRCPKVTQGFCNGQCVEGQGLLSALGVQSSCCPEGQLPCRSNLGMCMTPAECGQVPVTAPAGVFSFGCLAGQVRCMPRGGACTPVDECAF